MRPSHEIDVLRERAVADLRVLQRLGGDELIVGIFGSLLRMQTQPLKYGRTRFSGHFKAGVFPEPPPPPTRRQLRAEERRRRELNAQNFHGLPGG